MAKDNYSFQKRKKELARKKKKEEKRLRRLDRKKIQLKEGEAQPSNENPAKEGEAQPLNENPEQSSGENVTPV